ncbi:hypothetical protein [Lentimicrobium sp.]|jgi:hypothetical protein|uniref:hypothetical protein n=1 Tax=Lentimicrobium sp. TaxID=2034841 RepID=UPI002B214A9F|nr:hypothetical protein [Lentimicrobium sp.]
MIALSAGKKFWSAGWEPASEKDYLRSYNKREREILDFFIPFFEAYPAKEYFSVFDREFFRLVKV